LTEIIESVEVNPGGLEVQEYADPPLEVIVVDSPGQIVTPAETVIVPGPPTTVKGYDTTSLQPFGASSNVIVTV